MSEVQFKNVLVRSSSEGVVANDVALSSTGPITAKTIATDGDALCDVSMSGKSKPNIGVCRDSYNPMIFHIGSWLAEKNVSLRRGCQCRGDKMGTSMDVPFFLSKSAGKSPSATHPPRTTSST